MTPLPLFNLNIQVSSGKVLRPTTLGPTGERYRTLASANSSSGSSPVGGEREEVDNGKFGWLQLQNSAEEEGESSLVEAQKRGHARSTSLDLNKMLQGEGSASGEKVVRGFGWRCTLSCTWCSPLSSGGQTLQGPAFGCPSQTTSCKLLFLLRIVLCHCS